MFKHTTIKVDYLIIKNKMDFNPFCFFLSYYKQINYPKEDTNYDDNGFTYRGKSEYGTRRPPI